MTGAKRPKPMTLRPYQAMCIVCSLGKSDAGPTAPRLKEILEALRKNPDQPVALCCNSSDQFAYQNPGLQDDTPEGADFNVKRDMEILLRMDLAPGSVLPARVLLLRLLNAITSTDGICGYDTVTSGAWRGCPKAKSGLYEAGQKKGIAAIFAPREKGKMADDKQKSLEDMAGADAIRIRPHILVCAVAQYGNGVRPPFDPDNLPEMIQLILQHPETPITLVTGADWMMCGPCPSRVADLNACVCGKIASGGLYNEMKDLNVLRVLGLTFGTTMPAREIYKLIFDRIPKTDGVCALTHGTPENSVWRDGCGRKPDPCPGYRKGREELMGKITR